MNGDVLMHYLWQLISSWREIQLYGVEASHFEGLKALKQPQPGSKLRAWAKLFGVGC